MSVTQPSETSSKSAVEAALKDLGVETPDSKDVENQVEIPEKDLPKEEPKKEESKKEEPKVKKEESKEEEEEEEEVQLDEKTQNAINLYELLTDPTKAQDVIRDLAEKAGLLKAETPKEEKKAENKLDTLIKETFGEELSFIGDKLQKVLKVAIEDAKEEWRENIRQQQTIEARNRIDKFFQEEKVTEKESEQMTILFDKFKPSKNVSVEEYMSNMLALVRKDSASKSQKEKVAKKVAANLEESSTNLGTSPEAKVDNVIDKKPLSAKDAVQMALRELMQTK